MSRFDPCGDYDAGGGGMQQARGRPKKSLTAEGAEKAENKAREQKKKGSSD
jgi:hypothetical protein